MGSCETRPVPAGVGSELGKGVAFPRYRHLRADGGETMQFKKVTLQVTVQDQDSDLVTQALDYALDRIEERVTVIWSDLDAHPCSRSRHSETLATPVV